MNIHWAIAEAIPSPPVLRTLRYASNVNTVSTTSFSMPDWRELRMIESESIGRKLRKGHQMRVCDAISAVIFFRVAPKRDFKHPTVTLTQTL